MNIGALICGALTIIFGIIGLIFALLKEKAAKLVSGFNSLSKEEQELYDQALISKDMRNQFFIWALTMLIGTILSYVFSPYLAILAFIVWLILFFREVHSDIHKAFEKYKVQ